MGRPYKGRKTFRNYPCARYATDVTFELAYRPSESMHEGKMFYSEKQKAYSYEVEFSHKYKEDVPE